MITSEYGILNDLYIFLLLFLCIFDSKNTLICNEVIMTKYKSLWPNRCMFTCNDITSFRKKDLSKGILCLCNFIKIWVFFFFLKKRTPGNSLVVQCLVLWALTSLPWKWGSIPILETKIPQARQLHQKKKKKGSNEEGLLFVVNNAAWLSLWPSPSACSPLIKNFSFHSSSPA